MCRVLIIAFLLVLPGCSERQGGQSGQASTNSGGSSSALPTQIESGDAAKRAPSKSATRPGPLKRSKVNASIQAARRNLERVAGAVTVHAMSEGKPPARLSVLVKEGHVKPNQLRDPWGQDLRLSLATGKGHTHQVCSSGPDRRFQTADDICVAD